MIERIEPEADADTGERTPTPEDSGSGGEDRTEQSREELLLELESALVKNTGLKAEVSELKARIEREKSKYKELWKLNCEQLAEYDAGTIEKDDEIGHLKARVDELEAAHGRPPGDLGDRNEDDDPPTLITAGAELPALPVSIRPPRPNRQSKAPPVDPFDSENPDVTFEDWFPTLQRAANWNRWSKEDSLLQLADHLRKRALVEWNLLSREENRTLASATEALCARLDPGSRTLSAHEFRHAVQKDAETVADYILRLEQTYKKAYGRDQMSTETRDTLLCSQLQEGLIYELMKAPGSVGCPELP